MEKLSAFQAAKLLGISIAEVETLEKQGVIQPVEITDGVSLYSLEEIAQIKSRHGPSLSEEAAQVGIGIQREVASSVAFIRKTLVLVGGILSGYILLVVVFAALFIVSPLSTAKWLGIVQSYVDVSLTQGNQDKNVLGVETNAISGRNSSMQTALQPIGKVSLWLVKSISPDSYAQVSKVAILDTNDVLGLDTSGAITPERPINLLESSFLKIGSSELIANLNSQFVQGKKPGTDVGDIAIVGESSVPDLVSAAVIIAPAATGANAGNFALTVNTSSPLSGGGLVSSGGVLTLSCPTCVAGISTISGLTNSNLSGLAGITNANLANSSITTAGNSGSGAVSLGGGLTFSGSGITNIVAAGSTLTVTSTEADTLASVLGRGSSTSVGLTLDGGVTTTTSTALTLDSGTTGGISIGTGANAKTVTIGNTTGATAVNVNAGTGNVNFIVGSTASGGKVQIGNSGTATPDLLVLDNGTADPTGVNGGMYYNSSTDKFRCFGSNAWSDCVSILGSSSDLQHAASYDTNEALTNIPTGGAQVTLGTVSVTPTSITGDVYVTGWADVYSSNGTDQPLQIAIETTGDCTGSSVGNASVTYTITTGASLVNDRGTIRVSGIAVDPGASAQTYSLCAAVTSGAGDSDILNWGIEALVIDTGADLAEIYTTNDASIEVGDVVSLDSSLQAGMKKSQVPYDRTVLGIISTRPGLLIGSVDKEGAGAMPVALSGRVPVKVSSQNGPIYAGDSLTTSSIAGVAMKATDAGAIIGTAMSSFEGEGTGQILAFVNNGYSAGSILDGGNSGFGSSNGKDENIAISSAQTNLLSYVTQVVSELFKNTIGFFGNVIFHADATFVGRPAFNKDTAGHLFIKAGDSEANVNFEREYATDPVVTANINLASGIKVDEIPSYAVYGVSTKGFKIKLSKPASFDVNFSWIALSVEGNVEPASPVASLLPEGQSLEVTTPDVPLQIQEFIPVYQASESALPLSTSE